MAVGFFWMDIYTDFEYIMITPMSRDWLGTMIFVLMLLPWFFSFTSWLLQFTREDEEKQVECSDLCDLLTRLSGWGEIRSVCKGED